MNRSSRTLQMLELALAALLTLERGHCALMTFPAAAAAQAVQPSAGHGCCAPCAPSQPRPATPAPACPCIDLPAVSKLSLGYRVDLLRREHLGAGIGALGSLIAVPDAARATYGDLPLSALFFVHFELR